MALETRGTWSELIEGVGVEIADVFDQANEEYKPGLENVLQVRTGVTGSQQNFTGKTGSGKARSFDDGDDIPTANRYKTYNTTVAWTNYGQALQVTKNTIEDREFEQVLDEFKDMTIAINYAQDESAMQIFNGGFSTTATVNGFSVQWYGDGEELFSTVHPTVVPGGSTQSNASSTGIRFSADNAETALVALVEQQTDDGLAMNMLGKPAVVVAPANKKEAIEITQSELQPDTANNNINVYRNGMNFDVVTSTYLADSIGGGAASHDLDNAWYMVVPQRAKLMHFMRQEPRPEKDVDILSKTATFTIDARWKEGVLDWRRTWGSKGNLASYSS